MRCLTRGRYAPYHPSPHRQERPLDAVSLTEAGARLSDFVDRVEARSVVEITRDGRTVARITAVRPPHRPIDLAALQALTARLPPTTSDAAEVVRAMRDGDRA